MPLTTSSLAHLAPAKPDVETFQTPFELAQMLAIYDHLQPARTLEVGTWHGGTLWHFIQHPATKRVVAVDDAMRNAAECQQWADDARTDLLLLHGPSQNIHIVETVRANGPYDFVFIDADHTLVAVEQDWANYGTMVAEGGAVAFHDILARTDYGVSEIWEQIKLVPGTRTVEIAVSPNPADESERCGIGIVWR